MIFYSDFSEKILKIFDKMVKKDKKQLKIVNKKIKQILKNPYHFKPLKGDKYGSRRVHLGHFVMIYEIDEKNNVVRFIDYNHHDKIY